MFLLLLVIPVELLLLLLLLAMKLLLLLPLVVGQGFKERQKTLCSLRWAEQQHQEQLCRLQQQTQVAMCLPLGGREGRGPEESSRAPLYLARAYDDSPAGFGAAAGFVAAAASPGLHSTAAGFAAAAAAAAGGSHGAAADSGAAAGFVAAAAAAAGCDAGNRR